MAAINPPAEWSTDQALLAEADVDLVVFTADLTKGYPRTAIPAPPETVFGGSGTDTVTK